MRILRTWRLLAVAIVCALTWALTATALAANPTVLTVGAGAAGRAMPAGFVGLSMEYPGYSAYAGDDPTAPNPILVQLIKNLTPGEQPVIRIGGDSTDWTWFPVAGVARPPGIRFTLSQRWIDISRALTQALNARLILGINLEADSGRVASGEAQALLAGLGRSSVQALELGNEPELYSAFAWYRTPSGQRVLGRPKGWTYADYQRDYGKIVRSLPSAPLAGPSIGSPAWSPNLASFLRSQRHTSIATLHRYPLKRCTPSTHVTAAELLSAQSATGLANGVAGYAKLAHERRIPLRIDEMNSISCGGQRGLSDSYASALWAVDALYAMARVGVDGVNIHTVPKAINQLFSFHHPGTGWVGSVNPLYYGLLMFAQAAPPGSRLLRIAGQPPGAVRVWATRATDGSVRTVLINDGVNTQTVKLRLATPGGNGPGGVLERLQAPSVTALGGITLGGQSFDTQTTTGQLAGQVNTPTLTPRDGLYTVTMPPASAALLTTAHH